ncbi:MAG: DUF2628 domain-containing protein [Tagaea sp.]|nr:DUF2628 domain-containing protein [Tagaea sp.]
MFGPKRFTAHLRPFAREPDRGAVFVKDGFSWPAFVFLPLWALVHRLWWVAFGIVVAYAALILAVDLLALDMVAEALLGLGFSLIVGFEANDWRRAELYRRGWIERGVTLGRSLDEAELDWFRRNPAAR